MAEDAGLSGRLQGESTLSVEMRARIGRLRERLEHLGELRYVSYATAEALAGRLAGRLREALEPDELERARFIAIPRGGWIVLGMLAYQLDRPVSTEETPGDRVTVVVDDCSLTGARFGAALAGVSSRRVVFAHLLSTPTLRRSIEEAEPAVRCLAADDLAERREVPGRELRRSWGQRLKGRRYALVATQPVAFAWSEPPYLWLDEETRSVEQGWRTVAPDRCLAHRGRLGPPPARWPHSTVRLAPGVVWGEFDEGLWLCEFERERVVALHGSGAELVRRIARHGDPSLAAEEVALAYGVPEARVREDLEELLADLAERGLVERAEPPDDSGR